MTRTNDSVSFLSDLSSTSSVDGARAFGTDSIKKGKNFELNLSVLRYCKYRL